MRTKTKKKLKKIYDKIPKINCKGLCHPACTIIRVENVEREIIVEKMNFDPFMSVLEDDDLSKGKIRYNLSKCNENRITCPMLNANNQCSIYNDRPFICRVYGTSKKLECPFGCQPDRWISEKEGAKLLMEIEKL